MLGSLLGRPCRRSVAAFCAGFRVPIADCALAQEALQRILGSSARLKLIVVGPGTGKTFTFQWVLDETDCRGLAITFLLGVVSDLHEAIGETTDVYLFHGFARRLLHRVDGTGTSRGAAYYPPRTRLLVENLRIVDCEAFDELQLGGSFRNLADEEEFQDFCPLEVQLVKLLATKSPTLIVGDDDQALYGFRDAQPKAIRELAGGRECERFELPFATRCTEVFVEATHAVVRRAQEPGLLEGKLDDHTSAFWISQ